MCPGAAENTPARHHPDPAAGRGRGRYVADDGPGGVTPRRLTMPVAKGSMGADPKEALRQRRFWSNARGRSSRRQNPTSPTAPCITATTRTFCDFHRKREQCAFNVDAVRLPYAQSSRAREGKRPTAKERVGYPAQKPPAPYERIIKASSNEGDLALDPFCGCATTPIAAEKLGRQWVGIDIGRERTRLFWTAG